MMFTNLKRKNSGRVLPVTALLPALLLVFVLVLTACGGGGGKDGGGEPTTTAGEAEGAGDSGTGGSVLPDPVTWYSNLMQNNSSARAAEGGGYEYFAIDDDLYRISPDGSEVEKAAQLLSRSIFTGSDGIYFTDDTGYVCLPFNGDEKRTVKGIGWLPTATWFDGKFHFMDSGQYKTYNPIQDDEPVLVTIIEEPENMGEIWGIAVTLRKCMVTPGGIYGMYEYKRETDGDGHKTRNALVYAAPGAAAFTEIELMEMDAENDRGVVNYSYDGGKLYYQTVYFDPDARPAVSRTFVYEANPDGSGARQLMEWEGEPCWGVYDGVVYWNDDESTERSSYDLVIKSFDVDTGEVKSLFNVPKSSVPDSELGDGSQYVFNIYRAGEHLYLHCFDAEDTNDYDDGLSIYYRMNLDGSDVMVFDTAGPALKAYNG